MGRKSVVGAFCCAMLLSSSTWAASLQPGQGSVDINQGQGFQRVDTRVDTNVGDSIMVGPGGSATITYEDGCTVTVEPGTVASVAPISPCAAGSYAQQGQYEWVNGVWTWVIAGAAAGGIAAGIYAASTSANTNQTPASP